jgi:hypothetical protein
MTAPTWDNKPDRNDAEIIEHDVEFAAAARLTFFSDAVVAIVPRRRDPRASKGPVI